MPGKYLAKQPIPLLTGNRTSSYGMVNEVVASVEISMVTTRACFHINGLYRAAYIR